MTLAPPVQPMSSAPPPVLSRDAMRSRRKRLIRAKTLRQPRTTQRLLAELKLQSTLEELRLPVVHDMPKTRGQCEGGHRPCPYVSCKYNLYVDVKQHTGSVKVNFPDLEPDQMVESCVLDVADRGGITLEDVGAIMNVTRERVRQLEGMALQKLEGDRMMKTFNEDMLDSTNAGSGLELVAVLRWGPA